MNPIREDADLECLFSFPSFEKTLLEVCDSRVSYVLTKLAIIANYRCQSGSYTYKKLRSVHQSGVPQVLHFPEP